MSGSRSPRDNSGLKPVYGTALRGSARSKKRPKMIAVNNTFGSALHNTNR